MYHTLLASVALVSSVFACPDVKLSTDATGWNCYQQSAVRSISYQNVAASGTYQQVTGMDMDTGECTQKPVMYSGDLGPLSEELSVHFRGPVNLKRFAAYSGSTAPPPTHRHKRGVGHLHRHRRHAGPHRPRRASLQKRACGDWVTATYPANGAVFSFRWEEGCAPEAAATPAPVVDAVAAVAASAVAATTAAALSTPAARIIPLSRVSSVAEAAPVSQTSSAAAAAALPASAYTRTGFYDSTAKTADGLTFLANVGSGKPGVQNALTHVAADGRTRAASPQVLADTVVPSSNEFAIYSDMACSESSCAWSRPDVAAYHGFGGATRAFVFEFNMPDDSTGNNMPAIWFLNAQLARTQQYAERSSCKCWPACGEVDVFETLAAGEGRAITAIHGAIGSKGISGGSTNWFSRPKTGTATVAVVFQGSNIDVQVLDGFDWGSGSGEALVARVGAARSAAAVTDNGGI